MKATISNNLQATKVHVGTKKSGKINKNTHEHTVTGLLPNRDYVFLLEVVEKTKKKKSGPTTFRTQVRLCSI